MTQFTLIHSDNKDSNLLSIESVNDEFLQHVAKDIFTGINNEFLFVINNNGKSIDDLLLDAHSRMANDYPFEQTLLYAVVSKLVDSASAMIFWYGSDYKELEMVRDKNHFFEELRKSTANSMCEFYRYFIPAA